MHMRAPMHLLELEVSQKENGTKHSLLVLYSIKIAKDYSAEFYHTYRVTYNHTELTHNPCWVLVYLVITGSDNATRITIMTSDTPNVL